MTTGFNDDQGTRIRGSENKTGAGAEAAEGIHGQPRGRQDEREPEDKSSLSDRETGESPDRQGSEPLGDSEQHQSRYGGEGGEPKDATRPRR